MEEARRRHGSGGQNGGRHDRAAPAPQRAEPQRRAAPSIAGRGVRASPWRWSRWRLALALPACSLATLQGTVAIPPLTIIEIILRHLGLPLTPHWRDADELIIMQVRLPRALGAALVGAALGVSGALLQGLLRNPLADPLLLGTSSGAGLGAVVAHRADQRLSRWTGWGLVWWRCWPSLARCWRWDWSMRWRRAAGARRW